MRLPALVAEVHGVFDVAAAMADVAALCAHDRYQASAGIDAAADLVAERAVAAGLVDVAILRFPADGTRRWWTYHSPRGWTPHSAAVYLGDRAVLRYPEQPYALAAYSAATPVGGTTVRLALWSTLDGQDLGGALLVVDRAEVPVPVAAAEARARGALGVVADPLGPRTDRASEQVGRIELPPGSDLVGFSANPRQLALLIDAARAAVPARVVVRHTTVADMPVVTGLLPGADDADELLLTAHLCHPRPSANDNASGVAALLGIARALRPGHGRGVRFLWGPEFVGTAAYLHDMVHGGQASRPALALNVDMAGEDQRRCGGPLVIERAPDELPSFLSALVERCANLLPAAARSYSGAVPCDTWAWRSTPHLGASDHALLVAPPTRCPSVGIGHWPDRFNHTSADTLDMVDPEELRRTATIAGATIAAIRAAPTDAELAAELTDTTLAWAIAHVCALPGPTVPSGPAGVLDPWAPEETGRRLAHRGAVALRTLRSLAAVAVPDLPGAVATLTAVLDALRVRHPAPSGGSARSSVPAPNWAGPFNLRAVAAASGPTQRAWLDARIAEDRGGGYARMHALARGLDGNRDRCDVAWWAALASELAMPVDFAEAFLDLLAAAGWAEEKGGIDSC